MEERLTQHFTLGELTKTNVMTAEGNSPSAVQKANLRRLCDWLEQLRLRYNRNYVLQAGDDYETSADVEPLIINSAYRSAAVNRAVGGSPQSNHLTGCAVDIRCMGMEQALRYAVLLIDLSDEQKQDFDELLLERNARGAYWLHFAVRPPEVGNRRRLRLLQV